MGLNRLCIWLLPTILFSVPAVAATEAPVTVSPGLPAGLAGVADPCPTFHWGGAAGAETFELVVYRLTGEEPEQGAVPVIRETLPGSAYGWTPPLDRCLERGGRYAWSLRAVGEGTITEWSVPALFRVAAGATALELEEALEIVRRWLMEARAGAAAPAAGARDGVGEVDGGKEMPFLLPRSSATGAASRRARPATSAAPSLGTASLTVDQQIHLGADSSFFKEGELFLWGDTSSESTSLGWRALAANEGDNPSTLVKEGEGNTAVGSSALSMNTTGWANTAVGEAALERNEGDDPTTDPAREATANTAIGWRALQANTIGAANTAVGAGAMSLNTTGDRNVAVGDDALSSNSEGRGNIGVGADALRNALGHYNLAAGISAGSALDDEVNPESSNILLNNLGVTGESNTLRLGWADGTGDRELDAAYIHGIYDREVDPETNRPVYIDATGKLGTENQPPAAAATTGGSAESRDLLQRLLDQLAEHQRQIQRLEAEVARLRGPG